MGTGPPAVWPSPPSGGLAALPVGGTNSIPACGHPVPTDCWSRRSVRSRAIMGSRSTKNPCRQSRQHSPLPERPGSGRRCSAHAPVLATSIVAGTMAVKNTSSLIPFCHPLPITSCDITIRRDDSVLRTPRFSDQAASHICLAITCKVKVTAKTGVEMEALTGSSVAALCIYDMCKAISHDIIIAETRLLKKTGGKSGNVDFNEQVE